jgi:3-deoxy-D-manno-octulosonic-acid transferase
MSNNLTFRLFRQIYTAVIYLGMPALNRYQKKRIAEGKEDPERISERKGITSIPRRKGQVVWVHGASVGESLSVLPVIEGLLEQSDDISVVLTTGTLSSASILKDRLPDRAIHQFTPLDHPAWIQNFLKHWKPSAVVWLESEFWPNTLHNIKKQNIPLILLNGRVSDRSFSRWRKLPFIISGMLNLFDECLAQSDEDARRLYILGARNAVNHGNIKLAAPALPADENTLNSFKSALGVRPRWMLSSSHEGEEAIAGEIHLSLSSLHPDMMTLIVPRHPQRGPAIAALLRKMGITTGLRSAGDMPQDNMSAYVADTVGELGIFYRLCDIVVIGKSFVPPWGGQNPFEAVKLEKAVILGPNMSNFTELTAAMLKSGAATQLKDKDALRTEINSLLTDDGEMKKRKLAAQNFASGAENIIGASITIIRKYL